MVWVPLLACPAVQAWKHCWTSQQWHPQVNRSLLSNSYITLHGRIETIISSALRSDILSSLLHQNCTKSPQTLHIFVITAAPTDAMIIRMAGGAASVTSCYLCGLAEFRQEVDMLRRIAPIVVIYLCTAATWLFPGKSVDDRTREYDTKLRGAVGQLWGTKQKTGGSYGACSGRSVSKRKTAKTAKNKNRRRVVRPMDQEILSSSGK